MNGENSDLAQLTIVALTPVVVAILKKLVPKIPKAWLPMAAPLIGAGVDIAGHYAGVWEGNTLVGALLGMAGTGLREMADQTKKSIKPATTLPLLLLGCGLMAGCATYTTTQKDVRYEQGRIATEVTTQVTAYTLFDGNSNLANFEAKQTQATQSTSVGSLNQSASGTNVVNVLNAISAIVGAVK